MFPVVGNLLQGLAGQPSLGVVAIDELDEEARAEIEKLRPKDWWLGQLPEQDQADDNRA
jgi:hypothetical protein